MWAFPPLQAAAQEIEGPPDFALADSANIAASAATSTTAQLTAPSGKTTSNFTAMKISDDTNPITSDIAQSRYGEVEFAIQSTANAALGTYQFRIVIPSRNITYTVTPTITLVVAGQPAARRLSGKQFRPLELGRSGVEIT